MFLFDLRTSCRKNRSCLSFVQILIQFFLIQILIFDFVVEIKSRNFENINVDDSISILFSFLSFFYFVIFFAIMSTILFFEIFS